MLYLVLANKKMDFETLAKKRASIRRYSDKKPKIETLIKIIEIANTAPSPGNLPILKYILVQDKEKIKKISEACTQDFIADSPYLIVLCSESKDTEIMYDKRAKKYIKHHVGAAIENMLLYITELGLASCWIGAYSEMMIKNILKIPENIEIEAIIPVAYQLKIDKTTQKKKPPISKRIFFEEWGNQFSKPIKRFDT